MAFNSESGAIAGSKSKRGADNQLREIREVYFNLLEDNSDNIQKWLNEVAEQDPAKALELLLKISSFVIPKPKTIQISIPHKDKDKLPTFGAIDWFKT
jgi:hypothetical protein